MTDAKPPAPEALRALLDSFLRCPVQPTLEELTAGLHAHQTAWIRGRGADGAAPSRPQGPRPRHRLSADERAVLERLAAGERLTTADVARWAWFENRELVALAPDPAGGPDILTLTDDGRAAAAS